MAKSGDQVIEEFNEAVNMSAGELEDWLETNESKEVGQKDDGDESKGQESGRRTRSSAKTRLTTPTTTSTT